MAARYSVAELVNLLRGVSIGNEFNRKASTIDAKRVRYIESDDSEGEEDDEPVMRRGVRRYRGRDVDVRPVQSHFAFALRRRVAEILRCVQPGPVRCCAVPLFRSSR